MANCCSGKPIDSNQIELQMKSILKLFFALFTILFGNQTVSSQEWTLKQCIDTALVKNKSVQLSKNNHTISEERWKESKANLLPKIGLNAEYKYFTDLPTQLMPLSTFNPSAPEGQFKEAQFGVPHNINASIQLLVPLYNPQLYGAINATELANQLNQLQTTKVEEQLAFDIANMYYSAQIIYSQIEFIDSNLINSQKVLSRVQKLHEQSLSKGTDVQKMALQIQQLSNQKNQLTAKHVQLLNALKFAIGLPQEMDFQTVQTIQYETSIELENKPIIELQLNSLQQQLQLNELKTLNHSRFLPNLNLIANYGTMGLGYDQQPSNFLNFYPIGFAAVQFSYPLFSGTQTLRKINQKQFELQNTQLQRLLLEEQNAMQIRNAKQQRSNALETIATSKEQITFAQTIYQQTQLQYSLGSASLTEVLLADNALREAQQTYLTAIIDYLKATLELTKLTGNNLLSNH